MLLVFSQKKEFLRHEVAIIYWNPGPVVLSKETGIHLPIFYPSELSQARMETPSVLPKPKDVDCYKAHKTSYLVFGRQLDNTLTNFNFIHLMLTDFDDYFFAICSI